MVDIKNLLSNLPPEGTYEFENALTEIVTGGKYKKDLEEILPVIIEDTKESRDIRYSAFYLLNIYYRHNKKYTLLSSILLKYSKDFSRYRSFVHLEMLCNLEYDFERTYNEIIPVAHQRARDNENNAGCLNMFAYAVAKAIEIANEEHLVITWYAEAVEAIKKAIYLNPGYAKYYYVYARLLLINKEFESAQRNINNAIKFEDADRPDYTIRVSDYQFIRLRILIEKQISNSQLKNTQIQEEFQKNVESTVSDIKGNLLTNIEIIGFFAGVMSFTIGTLQIAISYPIEEAIFLIVALFASLMGVYSGFGFLLSDSNSAKQNKYLLVCFLNIFTILLITLLVRWFL